MIHTPAHHDHKKIFDLSAEFMQPMAAERAMRKNLKSKINLQQRIIVRDQMNCLKHIGTDEVQCIADKVSKKIKYDDENIKERIVKFIMNIKIDDARRDIEEAKIKVEKSKEELDNYVRPNTIAEIEYRKYVRRELENNWKSNKERVRNKVTNLKIKYHKRFRQLKSYEVPKEYKGVKISDELLGSPEMKTKTRIHEDVLMIR